jgi:hypothetical protein
MGNTMLKTIALAGALLVASMMPGVAKNLAVPADDPAVTLTVPNDWALKEIDFGYQATSPDKDVAFYVEYAAGARVKKMTDLNEQWMKENKIVVSGKPEEKEHDFNGVKGSLLLYKAKDENGPTNLEFAFIPAGEKRVIMLTLWGSDEEQKANAKDIASIIGSIKPIQ